MAQRRMFSLKITDSDFFTEMPLTAQCLYFHLSMHADDDGFVDGVRRIQRMIGATDGDLKILLEKRYVIPFDSGVCVIRHWRIHNYIQKDRYTPTVYRSEKARLGVDKTGMYVEGAQQLPEDASTDCTQDVYKADTEEQAPENPGIPSDNTDVYKTDTECIHRLGKDRDRLGEDRARLGEDEKKSCDFNENWRTSARARMAIAQVLVNKITAERLPIRDRNLYDNILEAMNDGVSPHDIMRLARGSDTTTFTPGLGYLMSQCNREERMRRVSEMQARIRLTRQQEGGGEA